MTLEDDPSLVGQTLLDGKIEVERKLGEGGMGVVYRVRHLLTSHARALKVLHPPLAKNRDVVKRFLREASVAGKLDNPRVVETFDAGELASGAPYVLMELLDGEPLDARLDAEGSLAPDVAARIAIEACEGLVAAHAAGIVHRDLKPENLFLARDRDGGEHVKLLDFGISKFRGADESLTATGNLLGTPMYMAPEQTEGAENTDERSDLYAVGVVLYEALAGRTPFEAPSLPKLLIKVHTGEHRPLSEVAPDVDPALVAVVEKAMAVRPEDRYPSASALIRALLPFAGEGAALNDTMRTQHATPAPTKPEEPEVTEPEATEPAAREPEAPEPSPLRWPWIAGAAALVAVLVLALGPWTRGEETSSEPVSPETAPVADETDAVATAPVDAETEPAPIAETDPAPRETEPGSEPPPVEPPEDETPATTRRRRRVDPPTGDVPPTRAERDGLDTESPY